MIKDIKSFFPYLFLIVIYFFFVNIEAKKNKNSKLDKISNTIEKNEVITEKQQINSEYVQRITIPVIPFSP